MIYNDLYRWDLLLTEGLVVRDTLALQLYSLQGRQPKDGCRGWTNQRWSGMKPYETFELRDVPHDVIPFDFGETPIFCRCFCPSQRR